MDVMKKHLHSEGYILISTSGHPYADAHGYVPEHRLVMETCLGRYVNPKTEHVHHINRNRADNNLGNLQLLTPKEHRRIHEGWFKQGGEWFKTCRKCGRKLQVSTNFYLRSSGKYFHSCIDCARKKALHNFHTLNGVEKQRVRRAKLRIEGNK